MEPTPRLGLRQIANLIVILLGVVLFVYFLIDDTPAAWLVRVAYAGALTAGIAAVLWALVDNWNRP